LERPLPPGKYLAPGWREGMEDQRIPLDLAAISKWAAAFVVSGDFANLPVEPRSGSFQELSRLGKYR
jgi:hypothetical protein